MRLVMRFGVLATLTGLLSHTALSAPADSQPTDNGNELIVAEAAPQAAFVLFPGAYLEPTKYTGLAQAIVKASHGRIAVFIPHFIANFANPLQAEGRVQDAIDYLAQHGVAAPAAHVFVGGHSQGGIGANDAPLSLDLAGLILLGSYLPHTAVIGKTLTDYAKPVLTLGAELDGLTGINYLAREAATVSSLATTDQAAFVNKPVVIVRGATHMQFADGSTLDGDPLTPEVTLAEAHAAMAAVIVDFIVSRGVVEDASVAAARSALLEAVRATNELLTPYQLAAAAEEPTCAELQTAASPLAGPGWERIKIATEVYRHGLSDAVFLFDKSSVAGDDQGYTLHLPVLIDSAIDVADVSKDNYLAPRSLLCKMRTASKLAAETSSTVSGTPLNCAELNQRILAKTLATITDSREQARFQAKFGDPTTWTLEASSDQPANHVKFGPLSISSSKQTTGQDWVVSAFSFASTGGANWTLTTGEVQTPDNEPLAQFAGANYCKVLPAARIIEWATLFGLK